MSTSAETTNTNKESKEDPRFRAPTPISSEEQKDSNIQFVEVQTLLFGENPAPLNPKTIQEELNIKRSSNNSKLSVNLKKNRHREINKINQSLK